MPRPRTPDPLGMPGRRRGDRHLPLRDRPARRLARHDDRGEHAITGTRGLRPHGRAYLPVRDPIVNGRVVVDAFHLARGYSASLAGPITPYLRGNILLGDAPCTGRVSRAPVTDVRSCRCRPERSVSGATSGGARCAVAGGGPDCGVSGRAGSRREGRPTTPRQGFRASCDAPWWVPHPSSHCPLVPLAAR